MKWKVETVLHGRLDQLQIDAIADEGGFESGHLIAGGDWHSLGFTTTASTDFRDAATAAMDRLRVLVTSVATIADLTVESITVQSEQAENRYAQLVSPGEFARMLGVSGTRLRQLRDEHPAFPPAVGGSNLVRRTDAEAFVALERRVGRPRRTEAKEPRGSPAERSRKASV